jgi:hypothetical protein
VGSWILKIASEPRVEVATIAAILLRQLTEHFARPGHASPAGDESATWLLEYRTHELRTFSDSLAKALDRARKRVVVLIDNEEYVFQMNGDEDERARSARRVAIQGLLYLCGHFNDGSGAIQVRYCIPAEQYYLFKDISGTASSKDFSRIHMLHWTVGELLSMIAHRYLLHLHVWRHESPALGRSYEELVTHPIYSREGAIALMRTVLPKTIQNSRGKDEDTLVYVLRHFQVLPRQLVALFNNMLAQEIRRGGDLRRLGSETVLNSVRSQETQIADEVISAYDPIYPEAKDVRRKVLPNMPVVFDYSDIRRFYDSPDFEHTGKTVLLEAKAKGKSVDVSPSRFERCLIETGIVGRLTSPAANQVAGPKYLNAEFEYSFPGTLDLSMQDKLAIHPIFSFQRQELNIGDDSVVGIYPRDSDPLIETDRFSLRGKYSV